MRHEVTAAETKGSWALWFGVLAGPSAWGAQVLVGGELPELGCAPGAGAPEVYGMSIEGLIFAATALLTAVSVLGGVVSYRCWLRARRGNASTGGRAAWMALAGIMINAVFVVMIVLGFAPLVFLSGCERSL